MTIKIKCPVCNARNKLTTDKKSCRRCEEDLSMLYNITGYSYKYRLYLLQVLHHKNAPQRRQLAYNAQLLKR
jgi:hypothetical protein